MSRLIVWPVSGVIRTDVSKRGPTPVWDGFGTSLRLDTDPGLVLYRKEKNPKSPEYYLTRTELPFRDIVLNSLEGEEALFGFQTSSGVKPKGLFTKSGRITNKKCKCKKLKPISVSLFSGMPRGKKEEIRQVRCSKCMGLLKGM